MKSISITRIIKNCVFLTPAGIVSYDVRQGARRGTEVNLYDFTYDGKIQDGILTSGLGQLVDMEEGISNFRLDKQGLGKKGYE